MQKNTGLDLQGKDIMIGCHKCRLGCIISNVHYIPCVILKVQYYINNIKENGRR